ncbi:copper chaperone PCu(A)C [Pseudoalteromonas sp. MMG022]|uniref:copper chaperone PCu(A)C n=1 Tax=Pseudoalteromonas sp. MMG022 TaxID=2909978 RepID=UPI001F32826C|nr:copper chaperone PCu(A)C [Pseudoalteromonas sp. MMG022]MCF6434995.1 copper chaperone PCu(A)C [Pseudoalteromonas sp. MMG022]
MFAKYLAVFTSMLLSLAPSQVIAEQGNSSKLVVQHAKIRQFLPAATSTAAYFSLMNHSPQTRILQKATISGLGRVEIHEHVHSDTMMRMQKVQELTISPHQTISFQPGGYHLMAFEPAGELRKGGKLTLTLYFANGEQLESPIKVVSLQEEMGKQENSHSEHKHH